MSANGSSPRRSRSQSTSTSYQLSPTRTSSKRAFSASASPRNIGPREKRPRRTDPTSPESFPPTAPCRLFDAFSAAPMPSPLTTLFTNHASSAPATPLLLSSSSSFFPGVSSSINHNNSQMQSLLPPSPQRSHAILDDLHHEAFISLRQSLAHSGEGFLRRMRDWEQRRCMESSKASMLGVQGRGCDRGRARRRKTPHTDNHTVSGISESHPSNYVCSFPADVPQPVRDIGNMSGYRTFFSARDESDIEDDMLIDNVDHSLSLDPSEGKLLSGSMGRPPMNTSNSQEPFAVQLAETDNYPSVHYTSTLDFPFTYSNTRSSSPFSLGNTSDDESSSGSRYDQPHSSFSSPCIMSGSADWSSHTISTRNQPGILWESVRHSSPASSPRPSSPGFSGDRFATRRHIAVQSLDHASMHIHPRLLVASETNSRAPQTASDKALAALVLTLANGSGSLADYSDLREAQGELEEFEAGGLWE